MTAGSGPLLEPLAHAPEPEWIDGRGGYRIPVRRYGRGGAHRPVVLLHGLQSHSAWFVRSAARLAAAGFPVVAFDRCGSGVSRRECDPGRALGGLIDEIDSVADAALADSGAERVHLLGHCFGAIPALLFAGLARPERVASVMLSTPAIHTRADIPLGGKLLVLWSVATRRRAEVPVPLAPEDFSDIGEFQEFVRGDALARHRFSSRFLWELRRARSALPRAVESLRAPLFVAMAADDRICDNRRSLRILERAPVAAEFREYENARHILEFSAARERFLDDLTGWLEARERD